MPSLLDCADEILVQIFTHTRRLYSNHVELNTLCQTCKGFERIARPLLVHRITHHPEPAIGMSDRREQTASIICFFRAHPDLIKHVKEVHIAPHQFPPSPSSPASSSLSPSSEPPIQDDQRHVDPLTTEERQHVVDSAQS